MSAPPAPPRPPGRAWSGGARRRLAGVLAAVLPPGELGGREESVVEFAGAFAAFLPPGRRLGIRVLVEALWWLAPAVLLGRFCTWGALGVDERERLLARVVGSPLYPLRMGGLLLKTLAALAVLGDPEVRAHLGLDARADPLGPLGGRVRWVEDVWEPGR